MKTLEYDFFIIGSGLAGLTAAWHLRNHGRVLLATKKEADESNSAYAQGGIACAIDPGDSIDEHLRDTLRTGQGLCDRAAARRILAGSCDSIRELEQIGLRFTRRATNAAEYDLGQEGGHSRRRVLHAGDITGREIVRVLLDKVTAERRIDLRTGWMAIDLVTTGRLGLPGPNRCLGAYMLDTHSGEIFAVQSAVTILATGGAGKAYLYTSNPDVATGDGMAMAWRAGLPIRNMEFVQFHPTCLYHPAAKSFLISEVVRGEGGLLRNAAGEPFMKRYDERGELAPRDVVARAIDHEIKTRGDVCVYLDISHRGRAFLEARFPNIYARCLGWGLDMAREPLPVVPAAHYCCGGVQAGVDGATAIPGLYAVGETACTGLHGANRLASNSLLEALVCGKRAAERAATERTPAEPSAAIPAWRLGNAVPSDEAVVVEHNWNEVRTTMWDYVGIVRTNKRLDRAARRISNLRREIQTYYFSYLVTADMLELRNIAAVAELIIRCARRRKESRGLHYTLDYPEADAEHPPADTLLHDPPGGPLAPEPY